MKKEELPNLKATFATYGLLMIPLVTLISMLVFTNYSVIRACLVCTLMCLVLALVRKGTRYNVRGFIEIMAGGMKDSLGVIAACACAGIVVGILTMTGLGNKLVTVILQVANGHLILALFLVMIVTIILGMGLPTTASYIVCSSVVVPALIKMGLEPLPAHMFVFYFACLSAVTPPVAIAAYAAAGISGGDGFPSGAGGVHHSLHVRLQQCSADDGRWSDGCAFSADGLRGCISLLQRYVWLVRPSYELGRSHRIGRDLSAAY